MTARAWQRMLSGRRLDLLDPSPLDVEVGDIAHGLARVARWNGQTKGEWAFSVAEHSVLVERLFSAQAAKPEPAEQLAALLHDAPEYVIGDMISPFKAALGYDYGLFEARLEAAVLQRFGLAPTSAKLKIRIKRADRHAAWIEAVQLAGFEPIEANRLFTRPTSPGWEAIRLRPHPPEAAARLFRKRFEILFAALSG